MTKIDTNMKIRIIAEYICAKQHLPSEIVFRALSIMNILHIKKKRLHILPLLDLTLRSIQLAHRAWQIRCDPVVEYGEDLIELSNVLSERIHQYETPRQ